MSDNDNENESKYPSLDDALGDIPDGGSKPLVVVKTASNEEIVEDEASDEIDEDETQDREAKASEERLALFMRLDQLVLEIESKKTDGSFELMELEADERIARARAMQEQLKPLIEGAEKLEELTPTEAKLLNDARMDSRALAAIVEHLKPSIESMPTMAQPSTPPPGAMSAIPETRKSAEPPPAASVKSIPPPLPPKVAAMPVDEPSVIIEDFLPKLKVGRSPKPENDFVVNDPSVSSNHAVLTLLADGKVLVEDLRSTNGTFVVTADGLLRVDNNSSPTVVEVGACLRFGRVEFYLRRNDGDGKVNLVASESQPTGHTSAFEARSEEESRRNAEEQAQLDAVDAAMHPPQPSETGQRPLRPVTSFERETAQGGSPRAKWGMPLLGAAAIFAALVALGLGLNWVANHMPTATTVAETDTTPPTTDTTVLTPTEVPTESTVDPMPYPSTGYNCHGVTADESCHAVASFLLTQGTGQPYWDCGGLNPDQARSMFRVEDPEAEHRRILADTCACQLCEPL